MARIDWLIADIDLTVVNFEMTAAVACALHFLAQRVPALDVALAQTRFDRSNDALIEKTTPQERVKTKQRLRNLFAQHVSFDGPDVPRDAHWSIFARLLDAVAPQCDMRTHAADALAADQVYWDEIATRNELMPDAADAFARVRAGGVRTIGFTADDVLLERRHGALPAYSVAHTVEKKLARCRSQRVLEVLPHVAVAAPRPKVERAAWEEHIFPVTGTDGSRMAMVGDMPSDMEAALAAGVQTRVYVWRTKRIDPPPTATHVIESLHELPAILT